MGADLIELAAPVKAEVVGDRKKFKSPARSVGRQTLKKQLGSGTKKRSASGVIPTKTAKQASRSRRNTCTNNSR